MEARQLISILTLNRAFLNNHAVTKSYFAKTMTRNATVGVSKMSLCSLKAKYEQIT